MINLLRLVLEMLSDMMKQLLFSCISHLFPLLFCLSTIDSVNKKVHFSPRVQTDARQSHFQARLQPTGTKVF